MRSPEDPDDDPEDLTLGDIYQMKREGKLFAELEGERQYMLVLHEIYPNGTSSDGLIEDTSITYAIGQQTGLGPPTDSHGWGVWVIGPITTTSEEGESQ